MKKWNNKRETYRTGFLGKTGKFLEGGEAGEDGAGLELEEVLPEEVLGVAIKEPPELTGELESEAGRP